MATTKELEKRINEQDAKLDAILAALSGNATTQTEKATTQTEKDTTQKKATTQTEKATTYDSESALEILANEFRGKLTLPACELFGIPFQTPQYSNLWDGKTAQDFHARKEQYFEHLNTRGDNRKFTVGSGNIPALYFVLGFHKKWNTRIKKYNALLVCDICKKNARTGFANKCKPCQKDMREQMKKSK